MTYRIINGKRYDTSTAKKVAEAWNGLGPSDFRNYSEELYRTPRGNWFLWGEGGPMTRYARPVGNNGYCGGSKLIPLTPEEAREWCEQNDEPDVIDKYLGDQVEDA